MITELVKRIYIVLDDKDHEKLKRIKEKYKLKWDEALVLGLECLERHPEVVLEKLRGGGG